MRLLRQLPVWLLLLGCSLLIHGAISWQVGHELELPGPPEDSVEVKVVLDVERPPPVLEPPERERIEFEEEIEFQPPEVLIAPKAITPPPAKVELAFRASAGGQASELPAMLPAIAPQGEGGGTAGFSRGIGNGLGDSDNRFAAYVANLREGGLDVMFVVDATGSMRWVIDEVKTRIEDIVDTVRMLVPIARFGIVAYRDYDSPGFTTREQVLTFSMARLHRFLADLDAEGGGSMQEAVAAGVRVAVEEAGWRSSAKRLIILIGDAPPHERDFDALKARVQQFARDGGQITTLDVSHEANPALTEARVGREVNRVFFRDAPMTAFRIIASAGGGDAATLDGDVRLTRRLVVLIMGQQFASEMQALLEAL